ncbi:S8 family serine peptidase [Ectobacillus sp. JY-23]|uniref:S8 family serine peptidase n=1 Tax=Ectobacillus sp. JY-23 TaxID=2933872 RepID=UPI001FF1ED99|nr:S8 family serine peptidase [Ectobacillus sp. JY-23]UOY91151.1 S8 family serine peptidase [Ectobacillus sp. JY-23]
MKKLKSLLISAGLLCTLIPFQAQAAGVDEPVKKGSTPLSPILQVPEKKQEKQSFATASQRSKTSAYKANEVIVKFKSAVQVQNLGALEKTLGLSVKKTSKGNAKLALLGFTSGLKAEEVARLLRATGKVEYAEPNYKLYPAATPKSVSDTYFNYLWGLKNTGQYVNGYYGTAGMDIKAEAAWEKTKGNASVVVGVIDSGTDISHPDLMNNIWVNKGEVPSDYIDNDKNGYVDDVNGWNFYNDNNVVYNYWHGDKHGTHVSGTIAASSNTTGVVGVAPNVKVMPIKFLGPDGGNTFDAVEAINYAKKMGVKITNNSWGGSQYSSALYEAIRDSNALFVTAAGNEGYSLDWYSQYPAAFDLDNIVSVAAIDSDGYLADFSNYSTAYVDLAAPGDHIASTLPENSYGFMSGTSMATPHVSGVAALMLSANTAYKTADLKAKLLASVTKLSTLTNAVKSGGLLNASAAVFIQTDNEIPGLPFKGTSVTNTLSSSDKDDVYAIALSQGDRLSVSMSGAAGTDFDVYLYGPGAKTVQSSDGIVAYSEKNKTSSEGVVYTAPKSGTYYIDASAFSGSGQYTLKIQKSAGTGAGTYENNFSALTYMGTWNTISSSSASGSSYAVANTKGAKLEFVFYGTGVSLRGVKANNQGIAKVTIDGASSEVSLHATSSAYKAEYYKKTGLSNGRHVLTIEWTGKVAKGARKSASNVNIDSITVYK